jgi:hypothetical protein
MTFYLKPIYFEYILTDQIWGFVELVSEASRNLSNLKKWPSLWQNFNNGKKSIRISSLGESKESCLHSGSAGVIHKVFDPAYSMVLEGSFAAAGNESGALSFYSGSGLCSCLDYQVAFGYSGSTLRNSVFAEREKFHAEIWA